MESGGLPPFFHQQAGTLHIAKSRQICLRGRLAVQKLVLLMLHHPVQQTACSCKRHTSLHHPPVHVLQGSCEPDVIVQDRIFSKVKQESQ